MHAAAERDGPLLIEATCNQVNQEGGYTGMTPTDFRQFVESVAARAGFDPARLILGGDQHDIAFVGAPGHLCGARGGSYFADCGDRRCESKSVNRPRVRTPIEIVTC